MTENEKDVIRQALSAVLRGNIGNTITAEVANGILVALNQALNQLPDAKDSKVDSAKKIKEVKDGQAPNNTGDNAQAAPNFKERPAH